MNMTEEDVQKIAKEAAREAIKELGLTHDDVKDMKSLVQGIRLAGKEALKTIVRIAVIGLCILGGIKYIGS